MIRPRRATALTLAWVVMIFAGTAYLGLAGADQVPQPFAAMVASEPAHVVAHLCLYGVLALGLATLARRRLLLVPPTVLAIAFLQECLQVVLFRRRLGRPEAFDLGVDLVAILVVVMVVAWRRRRGRIDPPA